MFKNYSIKIFVLIAALPYFGLFGQQELFMPRNIQSAYEDGTRSSTGRPGDNYWQNSSDYKIKVELDPQENLLTGSEKITYYNNSPDTLERIIIRLYQDIFKKGSARDFSVNGEAINEGVKIKSISIRNKPVDINDKTEFDQNSTNVLIRLEEPFPPESKIDLYVEWSFIIPSKVKLRMGAYDSTSFFIAYWFPQIAVYDDIDGWDTYNYGGYQEMYNDFSNFEVDITVPNTLAVWGTGKLENAEEVLQEKYLDRYNLAANSDTVVSIIDTIDLKNGEIINNEKEKNIWKFKAENITDFTFALSDHYLWDAVSVLVDSITGRKAFVQSAYKKESLDFFQVAEISKSSIEYFSFEMPGIAFPFPSVTVFNGSGGMEFPMMINDGSASTFVGTLGVTSHELAHQYFPFYVGTNERKYAFMDEGWAVMLPFNFQERNTEPPYRRLRAVKSYQYFAGKETEMPPMIPSVFLTRTPYRTASYNRPALAYNFLKDMLGDDLFTKSLQEFIKRWHGKHPVPYDMFFIFNDVSGENLNWYWDAWFFKRGYPDLKLKKVKNDNDSLKIIVEKIGVIPIPIKLTIVFEDGTETELNHTTAVWKSGNKEFIIEYSAEKPVKEIILGSPDIPDTDSENNLVVIH